MGNSGIPNFGDTGTNKVVTQGNTQLALTNKATADGQTAGNG
jgi:hypothetical protein